MTKKSGINKKKGCTKCTIPHFFQFLHLLNRVFRQKNLLCLQVCIYPLILSDISPTCFQTRRRKDRPTVAIGIKIKHAQPKRKTSLYPFEQARQLFIVFRDRNGARLFQLSFLRESRIDADAGKPSLARADHVVFSVADHHGG